MVDKKKYIFDVASTRFFIFLSTTAYLTLHKHRETGILESLNMSVKLICLYAFFSKKNIILLECRNFHIYAIKYFVLLAPSEERWNAEE